ncbi:MAG: restriction endonuclease subunit S [Candidatus Lindowbacteria bacterium]|nr:restriction endonuclease subunit S [Candidatus Lindowbacteria bacterium]
MKYNTCHLSDIAEIFSGFAFRSQDLGNSGIPVIKIANIQGKRVIRKCFDHFPEYLLPLKIDRYFLQDRDCLVAMTGAGSVGKFGKMFGARGSNYLINQRVGIIRPDPKLCEHRFIFHVLSNDIYEKTLYSLGLGAGQPNVSAKEIGSLEIPFPPLPTQRKIAAILSAYDDLIENNLRRIKILEEMAQNLYRECFVKFRFPGHQQARFVDSPLGRIPDGWEVRRISQFGDVITGKTPSKANPDFYGEEVPFVKTPDMHGNTFILDVGERLSMSGAKSQGNKMIPAGSICVSCIGTIGVVSITTDACQPNQQINSLILQKERFREFLFLRLKDAKQALENLGSTGATMGNVNKTKFESIEVITPPNDIADRYHEFAAPLFSEMLILSRKNATLRRTRDLLLPKLISGEVDVSELDITIPEEAGV